MSVQVPVWWARDRVWYKGPRECTGGIVGVSWHGAQMPAPVSPGRCSHARGGGGDIPRAAPAAVMSPTALTQTATRPRASVAARWDLPALVTSLPTPAFLLSPLCFPLPPHCHPIISLSPPIMPPTTPQSPLCHLPVIPCQPPVTPSPCLQ